MEKKEIELYKKIRTHLAELYDKWSKDPNIDGHHKSNEGYVSITFDAGNWFDYSEKEDYIQGKMKVTVVEVYSYLFGPSRLHTFSSLQSAWDEVSTWEYFEEI